MRVAKGQEQGFTDDGDDEQIDHGVLPGSGLSRAGNPVLTITLWRDPRQVSNPGNHLRDRPRGGRIRPWTEETSARPTRIGRMGWLFDRYRAKFAAMGYNHPPYYMMVVDLGQALIIAVAVIQRLVVGVSGWQWLAVIGAVCVGPARTSRF